MRYRIHVHNVDKPLHRDSFWWAAGNADFTCAVFACADQASAVPTHDPASYFRLSKKISHTIGINAAVHSKEHPHLKSLGIPSPYMNYTFTQVNYRVDLVSVRSKGFPHSCNYQCIHDMVIHADAGLWTHHDILLCWGLHRCLTRLEFVSACVLQHVVITMCYPLLFCPHR